jgi:hypothetical protein
MGHLLHVEEHQNLRQLAILEQPENAPPPVPVEEAKRLHAPRNAISVAAVSEEKGLLIRAAALEEPPQGLGARHLGKVQNQPPLNLHHPALR